MPFEFIVLSRWIDLKYSHLEWDAIWSPPVAIPAIFPMPGQEAQTELLSEAQEQQVRCSCLQSP